LIVGSTGSVKSTLVKLLVRAVHEVQTEPLLDGIELRDLKLKDLRSCIGLVSQDVFFSSWHCGEYCLQEFSAAQLVISRQLKVPKPRLYRTTPQAVNGVEGAVGIRCDAAADCNRV